MKRTHPLPTIEGVITREQIAATVDAIAEIQLPDGNIPWIPGHHTDPWNLVEAAGLWLRGSHHAHALHSPYWWIKCAAGIDRLDRPWLERRYHDLLVWQITDHPRWLGILDRALNPVLGKSLVVYAQKVT